MGRGTDDDDFRMESMMAGQSGGEFAKPEVVVDEKAMEVAENLDEDVDQDDAENALDDQATLVFKEANEALKREMKSVEERGSAPLSQVPSGKHGRSQRDDLDRFMRKVYPDKHGGFKSTMLLAGDDGLRLVQEFAIKEMGIDLASKGFGPANKNVSKKNFLKFLNKEHGTDKKSGWFAKFKESYYYNIFQKLRWLEKARPVHLNDFKVMRDMGRGAFGVVSPCVQRYTGELLALKTMDKRIMKAKAGANARALVANERKILAKLGDNPIPCCLCLSYAFETDVAYNLVTQFCMGGDLDFRLKGEEGKGSPIQEKEVLLYAVEIAAAIEHLHKLDLAHRDLKPLNVLLTKTGHCVLSDFGLACSMTDKGRSGRAGTPGYMPPEMLREERHFYSCDFYSYGITIYALLRGIAPFSPKLTGDKNVKKATLEGKMEFDPKYFSADAKDFIEKLCASDPKERMDIGGIKEHPFLATYKGKWDVAGKHELPSVYEPGLTINAKSVVSLLKEGMGDMQIKMNTKIDNEKMRIKGFNFLSRKLHRKAMSQQIEILLQEKEGSLPTYEKSVADTKDLDVEVSGSAGGGCCTIC